MFEVDWDSLLVPSGSLAEIALRGTIVYLALFATMRFLPRRELGGLAASDILVLVIIADAVQNAMAGGYESITEGLVLAGVIFAWATFIDWLDFKFPDLHLAEAGPMAVVKNGRLLKRNMAREHITEDEVMAELRRHGLSSPRQVKIAYVEGSGEISVVKRGGGGDETPPDRKKGV